MMNCPSCGANKFETLVTVERAPISCATLFRTKDEAAGSGACRLEIALCLECSHIWNRAFRTHSVTRYAGDYHSSVTQSPSARQAQQELAADLDKIVGLRGKTILEIGCGDGFFLNEMGSAGATAVGYEPSATFEIATGFRNIQVNNSYFDFDGGLNSQQSVDMVIMRHVLEHLPSPAAVVRSFTSGLFQEPAPKYLFIETPNSYRLLSDDLYFDFYNDHIQYFSPASLESLVCGAGWTLLARMRTDNEFIRLLFGNSNYRSELATSDNHKHGGVDARAVVSAAFAFKNDYTAWLERLKKVILGQLANGHRLAVWGAGARGISLLSGLPDSGESVSYIVDSDPGKHDKFVPLMNLPIHPVDRLKSDPVDCVLVSSYTFFDEISSQLHWFSEQGGKIIKVYPNPEVV